MYGMNIRHQVYLIVERLVELKLHSKRLRGKNLGNTQHHREEEQNSYMLILGILEKTYREDMLLKGENG
eukprot:snap_masked-scaffold_20-processed-gene-1.14-mRNA-1 protein AED:1.00 eAED:1.00 QI:0/-1/0/0/-1/1/1/0/68